MAIVCQKCGHPNEDRAKFCLSCGSMLEVRQEDQSDPLLGKVLLGRYRPTSLIGEGGMGRVYEAEQKMGNAVRKVAIKTLHPELSADPQLVARFLRECETVVQLTHPNTIQFYDFGELENKTLFIVMEFISGRALANELENGALDPNRVDRILSQICGSLGEAHERGIIHRDLKPENVLLTARGGQNDFVKVLDFGIAKSGDAEDPKRTKLTKQGMVLGTPPYMSPEQFSGVLLDARSDIYSLGIMAYEMLTGSLPFDAATPWEWATRHLTAQPTPFEAHPNHHNIAPQKKAAVMRALTKETAGRPSNVAEFLREFTGWNDSNPNFSGMSWNNSGNSYPGSGGHSSPGFGTPVGNAGWNPPSGQQALPSGQQHLTPSPQFSSQSGQNQIGSQSVQGQNQSAQNQAPQNQAPQNQAQQNQAQQSQAWTSGSYPGAQTGNSGSNRSGSGNQPFLSTPVSTPVSIHGQQPAVHPSRASQNGSNPSFGNQPTGYATPSPNTGSNQQYSNQGYSQLGQSSGSQQQGQWTAEHEPVKAKKNRAPLILSLVGLLGLSAVGIGLYVSSSHGEETAQDGDAPGIQEPDGNETPTAPTKIVQPETPTTNPVDPTTPVDPTANPSPTDVVAPTNIGATTDPSPTPETAEPEKPVPTQVAAPTRPAKVRTPEPPRDTEAGLRALRTGQDALRRRDIDGALAAVRAAERSLGARHRDLQEFKQQIRAQGNRQIGWFVVNRDCRNATRLYQQLRSANLAGGAETNFNSDCRRP